MLEALDNLGDLVAMLDASAQSAATDQERTPRWHSR
jgi:hypothetical protein